MLASEGLHEVLPLEKFVGFVLNHTDLSASRVVVDLFTEQGGTRQGVMRFGKKDSRALLTPLTRLSFQLGGREHQHLKNLSEPQVEAHCFDLAADYTGLCLVSHWAWLVRRTQPDEHPDVRVFRLLDHLLQFLRGPRPDHTALHLANLYFEIWLLHFSGILARQPITEDADSVEERLAAKLDRDLLTLAFQRKIEQFGEDALKLGVFHGSTVALGALWERLLDRELKARHVLYKQLKLRGNV